MARNRNEQNKPQPEEKIDKLNKNVTYREANLRSDTISLNGGNITEAYHAKASVPDLHISEVAGVINVYKEPSRPNNFDDLDG